jgi:hypothetical protein
MKRLLFIPLFFLSFTFSQDVILTFDCPEEVPSGSDGNWFSINIIINAPNVVTDMAFIVIINPIDGINVDTESWTSNDPFFYELFSMPCYQFEEGLECTFAFEDGNYMIAPGTYTLSYEFSAIEGNSEVTLSFDDWSVWFADIGGDLLEDDHSDLCTIQIVSEGNEEIIVEYQSDWNLVGLPLDVDDVSYSILFPESIEGTLYSFNGGYTLATILTHGEGYWLRFDETGSTNISGTPINELIISLSEGWNLISGISTPLDITEIQDPDGIIITGTIYGFTSGGYSNAEILEPGNGYWVRTNGSGSIILIDN